MLFLYLQLSKRRTLKPPLKDKKGHYRANITNLHDKIYIKNTKLHILSFSSSNRLDFNNINKNVSHL